VLLREGVVRLLGDAGFEVVGQAGDSEDLLRKVRAHKPDVAIVDVRMPPTHTDEGLQAAKAIRAEMPSTGVLMLSQYVEEEYVADLVAEDAEGVGYLLKDRVADIDTFTSAVRRVASGGSALDPEVVSRLRGRVSGSAGRRAAPRSRRSSRSRRWGPSRRAAPGPAAGRSAGTGPGRQRRGSPRGTAAGRPRTRSGRAGSRRRCRARGRRS